MFILLCLPAIFLTVDFVYYLVKGERLLPSLGRVMEFVAVFGLTSFYLAMADFGLDNDCCSESATFSPEHRATIYCWIVLGWIGYLLAIFQRQLAAPLLEVVLQCVLLISIVLNIFVGYQVMAYLWAIGNLPIVITFVIALMEKQKRVMAMAQSDGFDTRRSYNKLAVRVLTMNAWLKYPVLLGLCLPLIALLSAVLLLFGQKPDSLLRAFTDTYKHGFSQLDYMCQQVSCDGHYLCTVAAKGHPAVVKPQRLGKRHGMTIICNRQLLVSNAFEELVAESWPSLHRFIRKNYDKVGDLVERHYHFFENKYVSDVVYLLMKPAEWFFLLVL